MKTSRVKKSTRPAFESLGNKGGESKNTPSDPRLRTEKRVKHSGEGEKQPGEVGEPDFIKRRFAGHRGKAVR